MSEYDNEPIPGLPGRLPPGERILWQGSPEWRALARTAFRTRAIAGYFAILTAIALASGSQTGAIMTASWGVACVALLHLLAWASARTTIYTLTDRRIVLRIGIAVPKCVNLPLGKIASVDFAARAGGTGDLPLTLVGVPTLGYFALWPHARPLKLVRPQPMLRAIPQAADVAALVARTCLAANPEGRIGAIGSAPQPMPPFAEAQAA